MSNTSLLGSYGGQAGDALMFRNVLINGNFDVWQRATNQTTTGYGSADRWKFDVLTNITAARQPAAAPYGIFNMLLTPSSATNSFVMAQTIEDNQLVGLKGKAATVSFSANAASGTQTVTLYLQKSATANDSTGGGGGWVTISSLVCSITNAVQTFTMTALVPNDGTANGLRVAFGGTNTASGVGIALWGVQLEAGPTATPFERRPYSVELSMAQRYYWRWTATSDTTITYASIAGAGLNSASAGISLPVPMRVNPGITHNFLNANFVTANPTGAQWGVLISGVAFINKTGTAAFSIVPVTNTALNLRVLSADFASAPNALAVGPSIFVDANAEL